MDDREPFLSRWSRRKLEAKEAQPSALPAAEPSAAASAVPPVSATEPAAMATPQESRPEYRKFFDPRVDEKLRHIALRNLFSDPHFNVMDGLDTYVDDYSKPDPIPGSMLRQLNQAKELFLFDDEKKSAEGAADGVPAASAGSAAPLPAEAMNAGALPNPATAGASAQETIAATDSAIVTPEEGAKND